jgi:hypothetical protein
VKIKSGKKILIVSDYYQPFIGYSKVMLAKELLKKGYDVHVLTSNKFFPFPDYEMTVSSILGKRERKVGFRFEQGIPIERKKMIFEIFSRGLFFGTSNYLKSFQPDYVVSYVIASFSSIQVSIQKKKT